MAGRLHPTPKPDPEDPIRLKSKARMLASVSALLDIASRLSKKLKSKPTSNYNKVAPKSPMKSKPKQLMSTISNKFLHKKKAGGEESAGGAHGHVEEEEWGNGGVWQRSILMGDKCEPLDFSGVIYYDNSGNRLTEVPPKSPRASPLPGYLQRADKK